jgi:hypothetical protein
MPDTATFKRRASSGPPNGVAGHNPTAEAFRRNAAALARWAWDRYIIRDDVWGGYNPISKRDEKRTKLDGTTYILGTTCTRPAKAKRGTIKLTLSVLEAHFRGRYPEHVAGVHTTGLDNVCKFGTAEIDVHGEGGNDPAAAWNAAQAWYDRLVARGHRPLLWDSNGKGGYHLDLLFAEPVPSSRLFWYLRRLVADHSTYGLPARPETFPKQPRLTPTPDGKGLYGNWSRLPGRHHTRDHCAKIWDGSAWLEGDQAVEFMLAIAGDAPTLLPQDAEVDGRLRAFIAKLPNLGDGQGRDDVAYHLLAFAVRDLQMSDAESLRYAEEWDQGNSPPKGRERLREILANVHTYGKHPYGAGLGTSSAPSSPPPPASPPPVAAEVNDGLGIIAAEIRERYRPKFRKGQGIYSEALGREVKPTEGCFAPDRTLVGKLATARDAPKDSNGEVDPKRIPKFYRDWARSAWAEVLNGLQEEEDVAEVVQTAEEAFRRAVAVGLHEQATLGREDEAPERRSLIDWAVRFARPGPWKKIRSYLIWCRRETETSPAAVAVRVELFGRVRLSGLSDMSHRTFAALCALYGIGRTEECRAGGQRCVELTPEFLADVRMAPDGAIDELTMTGNSFRARARGTTSTASNSEESGNG